MKRTKRFSALALAVVLSTGLLAACSNDEPEFEPVPDAGDVAGEGDEDGDTLPEVQEEFRAERYDAIALPDEMRAMWVAYPDFEDVDFSSEEIFRVQIAAMMQNCADMGLNTVIVIVRPFADAFYPSDIFPWSHIVSNGVQGVDPGYDPMDIMVEEAHQRDLRFEAYINPYRVKLNAEKPAALCDENLAVVNPDWAVEVGESMWLDPAIPEVRQMVVDGVVEILEKYTVDGIHFDDYFYPQFSAEQADEDAAFDADTYAEYGDGMAKADWRRENVNTLVKEVYDAIKAYNPSVSFGISPAGNNDNNYDQLYADIGMWMATPGYVDYMMPQLYWEAGYTLSGGSTRFAFENITAEWAALPRAGGVKLYAGLAAYKLDEGESDDWRSGDVMASQVGFLRTADGYDGFALFRYGSLFTESGDARHAAEVDNLTALLAGA